MCGNVIYFAPMRYKKMSRAGIAKHWHTLVNTEPISICLYSRTGFGVT
jgi:hypothetical protein